MIKKRKYIRFGLVFLIPLTFIISQCFHKEAPVEAATVDPRGDAYAGAQTCVKCHAAASQNFFHTSHARSSRLASPATVSGSFIPGQNTVSYDNGTKVIMERHNDSLYQVTYAGDQQKASAPFDMVFGNKRAETYLYWKGQDVFELPVSYYIGSRQWGNSPGYHSDFAFYGRLIGEQCFECHASNIRLFPPEPNDPMKIAHKLDKSTLVLGIDCERCHGPGARHVTYFTNNPKAKGPLYIEKISTLSRQQRIDLCSQCHAGVMPITVSTFNFRPGDSLSNYIDKRYHKVAVDLTKVDVHGNQVGLITGSMCFIKGNLECRSCHDMHQFEAKSLQSYSAICLSCHAKTKHNATITTQLGTAITTNCVDCHMPSKSSEKIDVHNTGKTVAFPYFARMHRIAVYPEETQKVIAMINSGPAKTRVN